MAALFREHHGELVRLALLMVGDVATAEDVVQDVYASLHSRWSHIAARDAVLPYVRAAVLNGCRSVLRRRGGSLARGRVLLRQSARYPLIAQALGGPHGSDLTVAVLSGQANKLGERPELTVEDVSAATGAVRGVNYRVSQAQGLGGFPQQVWLAADPSGQHLLVSYAVDGGFVIGWIGQGALHRLPITQPYLPNDPTLIIAW